ncbi:MAG: FtsX-like permease family protein [Pirellulales bacterium]|nr:FtsX-like permease family protein [Pirellulales bacterium]
MYKLLLCWRYLRTRYIALVCIISVTLGVATMIVVNSVMAGFTHEMQDRLNGMLGDLIFRSRSLDGVLDADAHMAKIREVAGDAVAGMSPTVHVPALMYLTVGGELMPRQITLVGIDEKTYASVSSFGKYLQHPENRRQLDFSLRDGGYDVVDHQADAAAAKPRSVMKNAGWPWRRYKAMLNRERAEQERLSQRSVAADAQPPVEQTVHTQNPFQSIAAAGSEREPEGREFDPASEQHPGIVLGIGICGFRMPDGTDQFLGLPGDDVKISYPLSVLPVKIASHDYTVVDFYESKMSEYDSNFAFVPLKVLQQNRGLIDPETGVGKFTSIQIKLKPGASAEAVRDRLQNAFPAQFYQVNTWRDEQGPLLAAVHMETMVLNVLLFMIIAVAGFGILAIFYMIVVEKTRDIGILKSLGASGGGVMGIFLGYGLSLGMVGAGAGAGLGLLFVAKINEIADLLARATGQPVFDPSVYYFYRIPTIVEPFTVAWIAAGAVAIAVLASVLPARRAARLHPVRALRYE